MPARRLIECISWVAVAAMLAFFLANFGHEGKRQVIIASGAAVMLLGARAFIGHGGPHITILGLFNASNAIFVGFAGAYAAAIRDERVAIEFLGIAVLAGFALQILVTFASWGDDYEVASAHMPPLEDARWATRWSIVVLAALTWAKLVGLTASIGTLVEGAAFAATIVLAIGLLWRPSVRLLSWSAAVVGASFILYAVVFFSGAGRLRIVALACALGMLFSLRFQRRILKWLTVLAAPLAVALLAMQRLSVQESLQVGASAGRNGLESMLVPIVIFGQLVEAQLRDGFQLAWGSSFLTFPMLFAPEAWFPNGPKALGYELVQIFAPEMVGTGYSVAATVAGEAVYNFGLVGILLAVPLLVWALKLVDRRVRAAAGSVGGSRLSMISLALWVTVGGAVADLTWCGQHIFLTRTAARLPVLLFLVLVAFVAVSLANRRAVLLQSRSGTGQRLQVPTTGEARRRAGPVNI